LIELNPEEDAMKKMIRFFAIFALFTVACGSNKGIICQPQTVGYNKDDINEQIKTLRERAQEIIISRETTPEQRGYAIDASLKLGIAYNDPDPADQHIEMNEAYRLLLQAQGEVIR
jgi:hypothetical protein